MLRMYDFECSKHGVFEGIVDERNRQKACPDCNTNAPRLISAPRVALDGTDPDFPDAYDRWEKKRNQKQKIEEKAVREHGSINQRRKPQLEE